MNLVLLLLLVLAAVCFVLAALSARIRNVNLIALGLLFWVLVSLLQLLAAQ